MPDRSGEGDPLRLWPFASQYTRNLREGHHRQAPACGSPTLVWHMAVWPRHAFGDGPGAGAGDMEAPEAFVAYEADISRFFEEISAFAVALQAKGRVGEAMGLEMVDVELPAFPDGNGAAKTHVFKACRPQALGFTLWWADEAKAGSPNRRTNSPAPSDLRVRVALQTHRDHATLSFYIDVAKSYGRPQIDDAAEIVGGDLGARRRHVLEAVNHVRRVSGEQIRKGYVELSRIPEQGVSAWDAEKLLAAADYLYDGVWREFAEAFEISHLLADSGGDDRRLGERFADFRGLVLSISGLANDSEENRLAAQAAIRAKNAPTRDPEVVKYTGRVPAQDVPSYVSGTIGFGQLTKFDEDTNEANTVLKSMWPFMRRITPWADYSDWVGCGIIGGRALYVSALGSEALIEADNEESAMRAEEVPSGFLPAAERPGAARREPRPLRYLVITKGEPLREQLGRYVERINAVGTMRLFALRNIASIRNASIHIEVLGRMLDGTLQSWEAERQIIDAEYERDRREAVAKVKSRRRDVADIKVRADAAVQRVEDEHIRRLTQLIRKTEGRVIQIAGRLDSIGEGGSGRMLYVIKRALQFAAEYKRMHPTLRVVEVDGWINYENFVNRGVLPAFEFIEATGDRLKAIRERIQTVTETIQTAALIVETAATRENTATLNKIASSVWLRIGGGGLALMGAKFLFDLIVSNTFQTIWQGVVGAAGRLIHTAH